MFVTGSAATENDGDYAHRTIAYDANSGDELWAKDCVDPGVRPFAAKNVRVTSDGERLVVSGTSSNTTAIAYRADSGAELWVARNDGAENRFAVADMTIAPGGDQIYVTGTAAASTAAHYYLTNAYDIWHTSPSPWSASAPGHGL